VIIQTEFEKFALDHNKHTHCLGCGGCLLDPSHVIQGYPCWCITCRDRIKENCKRSNLPLPWRGGWEFV
jgi:hypothetical protein